MTRGGKMLFRTVLPRQHGDHARRGQRGAHIDRDDLGGRVGRPQNLHVRKIVDLRVHGVAGLACDNRVAGGGRDGASKRIPRRGVFDPLRAADRVLDGTIAGASTKVAFQSAGQIAELILIERRDCQNHPGRAEAALKSLRVDKGLLDRMKVAVDVGQAFNRCDGPIFGAERRGDAAVRRHAVDKHGAGPAVA